MKYLQYTVSNGDCLEWTRCFNSDGYPRALINGSSNGKVHREVFFLTNGFYPEVVRHKCDNIKCINPNHLEGGSNIDNIEDRHSRNRTHNQVPEELKQKVSELKSSGLKYREIAEQLGIKTKLVDSILYRLNKSSSKGG